MVMNIKHKCRFVTVLPWRVLYRIRKALASYRRHAVQFTPFCLTAPSLSPPRKSCFPHNVSWRCNSEVCVSFHPCCKAFCRGEGDMHTGEILRALWTQRKSNCKQTQPCHWFKCTCARGDPKARQHKASARGGRGWRSGLDLWWCRSVRSGFQPEHVHERQRGEWRPASSSKEAAVVWECSKDRHHGEEERCEAGGGSAKTGAFENPTGSICRRGRQKEAQKGSLQQLRGLPEERLTCHQNRIGGEDTMYQPNMSHDAQFWIITPF